MNASRRLPFIAGLGAAAVTATYVVIMMRQGRDPDLASIVMIATTFASSAAAFLASVVLPPSARRVVLLTWGSTVALFWTVLLNTLTPLWLPVAVIGWIATVREARSFSRESEGGRAWPLVGGTWAIGVALLGLVVFGSIAVGRSPESGTGQGIAAPR
ncbi:MAG: hypothetical protein EPO65_09765 [Dehalococcoidia bacterium]|nr:MAG: hypothetical protein EPO65_09765 [Dehalococcoidia bacterium]